jgi:CBS domain-containing protein
MKVRDIMMKSLAFCSPQTNLAAAAEMMWVHSCGILPVVDEGHRPIGVITDRDICIALGTKDRKASEMTAGEITKGELFYCGTEDDIRTVLEIMGRKRVRRLPVLGKDGLLEGILSMDDVVLHAGKKAELSCEEVVETYVGIAGHPVPQTWEGEARTTKVWR